MDLDFDSIFYEHKSGKLLKIPDDFFGRIKSRMEELEALKRQTDGDDLRWYRYRDEIIFLKRCAEEIFKIRFNTLIKVAISKVLGSEDLDLDISWMTSAEREFFNFLVDQFLEFKKLMLGGIVNNTRE